MVVALGAKLNFFCCCLCLLFKACSDIELKLHNTGKVHKKQRLFVL